MGQLSRGLGISVRVGLQYFYSGYSIMLGWVL